MQKISLRTARLIFNPIATEARRSIAGETCQNRIQQSRLTATSIAIATLVGLSRGVEIDHERWELFASNFATHLVQCFCRERDAVEEAICSRNSEILVRFYRDHAARPIAA